MDQAKPVSGLGWEFWCWFAVAMLLGALLGRLMAA